MASVQGLFQVLSVTCQRVGGVSEAIKPIPLEPGTREGSQLAQSNTARWPTSPQTPEQTQGLIPGKVGRGAPLPHACKP